MPKVIKQISVETIISIKLAIRKAVFDSTGKYIPVSFFPPDKMTANSRIRQKSSKLIKSDTPMPDELVYANGQPVMLEKTDSTFIAGKIKRQINKDQKPPVAFFIKDVGLFVTTRFKFDTVINKIATDSSCTRTVQSKPCSELQNQIAIVTGAGSGLGRSIAVGLARAGAMVGLADIDETGVKQTAEMISMELPIASTMVLKCDVTDQAQVNKTFDAILDNWGGLDVLVNAAGVAPAGPLVDLPVAKWRLALEINLTGYFLMAQAAARIMIKQGMGGSIINLSSKSGLDASKDNTPYNATKAGEIHIARGWALELGEYGIRVNSVCPGNVFEGSKIWNPEYIKVCAKKHGIKPQEVIPYYVNKTALRREIKGQDIANAVVFLCSDSALTITGQTLVVDSGQVMVR